MCATVDADDHAVVRMNRLDSAWHNDLIVAALEPRVAGRRFLVDTPPTPAGVQVFGTQQRRLR
jgi:hypothetical protein